MIDDLQPILSKLGYSPLWLAYGLIDGDTLQEQSKQYDITGHKDSEHYRYASFRKFLAERSGLDDMLLGKYIQLAQLEQNRTIVHSALILLVDWPHLANSQLDYLGKHPAFEEPVVQRRLVRAQLLSQLRSSALTEELFNRCLLSHDQVVHRELLERPDISRQQTELLHTRGANKAIRNVAKQMLQSRR